VKYNAGTQYADLSWTTEQLVHTAAIRSAYEVYRPKSGDGRAEEHGQIDDHPL